MNDLEHRRHVHRRACDLALRDIIGEHEHRHREDIVPSRPLSSVDRMLLEAGFDIAASDAMIAEREEARRRADDDEQRRRSRQRATGLDTGPHQQVIELPSFLRTWTDTSETESRIRQGLLRQK